MWTNVFKIGGLHQVSWFQFLPLDSDLHSIADKSVPLEKKDVATFLVLSSHLQLQNRGFLSTWTNSFVGPWDPSQGLHNPDEKIKLWLFLPGRHSSVTEAAQTSVNKLRVVASGVWLAPGDSEEVGAALSQALRNCIERSLGALSYMRYGDVYSKFNPSRNEEIFRRGQSTVEFVFAASEEAIFIHVIISAKYIRTLSSDDLESLLKRSSSSYRLPVIVSPNGMRGRLTGCCPSEFVKQVYFSSSKWKAPNGLVGLPSNATQGFSCHLRGQNCYVEVTLGCAMTEPDKTPQSGIHAAKSLPKNHIAESPATGRGDQRGSHDHFLHEKTIIYPAEAVLVPVLQTSVTRSSLKRFWLQNWLGPSLHGSSFFMHCTPHFDSIDGVAGLNGFRSQHSYYSSSNSNSSSLSSISSSSSESDYQMAVGDGDLDADADSLTCKQSDISSADHLQNDHVKAGSKRPRAAIGVVQDGYKSDFGSVELKTSAITGVANEQIGSHWDWDDDDDRGIGTDIQALLSEFGDFGDFFENDTLPFGEPPGTAESHALMFSGSDLVVGSSPVGMDVADEMLMNVGFSSFESFNPPPAVTEEYASQSQEITATALPSGPVASTPASSSGDFDHLIKAEALMTFAPEYGAVEAPVSDVSSSIFRSPYLPKSRNVESTNSSANNYKYGATPPTSPCLDGSDEKTSISLTSKSSHAVQHPRNFYTQVEGGKLQDGKISHENVATSMDIAPSSISFSNMSSTNAVKSAQRKVSEAASELEHFLTSSKTVIAMEIECLLLQSSMCKARHTLLSSGTTGHISSSRLTGGAILNNIPGDQSTITENISAMYEVKKKESIPVRIAGDVDGLIDGHLNAPVRVWRSVGVSKVPKQSNSPGMEVSPSLPHNSFGEEGILSYGQRHPLQELLDGMPFLVQQATSFVDVTLDADCGDGPYGWLALEEQGRRGFCCGPSMVHAGCGGTLSSCHFLDIAGAELVDPLSADVHASSMISLLQSDIRTALKAAFGNSNLEGPLSVTEWCKGRSQVGDGVNSGDGFSSESSVGDCRDPSSVMTLSGGEPLSPSQSTVVGSSNLKVSSAIDAAKTDDFQRRSSQESGSESEQQNFSRRKPALYALPFPALLVGYQDDWLKTSASSLQVWEKAPLEPYALQKPITYYVVCPDINPLTSAAADFFQQLGTVYETCNLGTHTPQTLGNQMEIDSGKSLPSGFVLLDCPQSMKMDSSNASLVGSISDYFLSLSNGWDLTSYLKSVSKTLKALKFGPSMPTNPKEGNNGSCMVIYVVCPFPEPIAVLKTVIESSIAVGSVVVPSDRRAVLHNQVGKALSCSAAVDETSISNILVLSGFCVSKLVLQIVTVDAIFRVTSPILSELTILKETAFTVYNKARRISRGSASDVQTSLSSRSQSILSQINSPISGMWNPRISGPSLPRDGDMDASMRTTASWESSWQTRTGVLNCDMSRGGDFTLPEDVRFMFEPLFILAEPGSVEHGVSPTAYGNSISESSKPQSDDNVGFLHHPTSSSGSVDAGSSSQVDGSEPDNYGPGHQKYPSIHCCYGWTEDWRWLVCIWTDARGELLDSHIFPFGGISSRQDTKGLQSLFAQVLQQGCQILQACSSDGAIKPRDFVITRIGSFYELEYLEWQKAIYSVGGANMRSWSLQLRRPGPDGMPTSTNGTPLQQQEMSLLQDRNLPSSPSPFSPHSKSSGYMKGPLGQPTTRKQLMGGHAVADGTRGLLQWVQNISFVTVSIDHSLHLVLQTDSTSPGGSQTAGNVGPSGYLEGSTPVKSLGSAPATYLFIPSPSMRFLPSTPLQLPTCLTAESPPLAHLLHSKGSAVPLSTAFVVSRAVPSMRKDFRGNLKEEWPSVLSVGLIDYYGNTNTGQEKLARGGTKQGGRSMNSEAKDFEVETHQVLESIAAELQALSWMTVSPAYLERRTALPFHCDMVLRLRRLLHFADKELSRQQEKP